MHDQDDVSCRVNSNVFEVGEVVAFRGTDGLHTAKFWREQSSLKIPSSEHCNQGVTEFLDPLQQEDPVLLFCHGGPCKNYYV